MSSRLVVVAVLGGLGALVAVVVLVFGFGRHDPSPPSLADDPIPAIPGRLLVVDGRGCIELLAASGASREQVYCPGPGVTQVAWIDADTIQFADTATPRPPQWTELDLATKETTETARPATWVQQYTQLPDGTEAWTEGGSLFVAEAGVREEIASFDVPGGRSPTVVTWSPDEQWLLLQYPEDDGMELWIVSRDGEVRGTLASGLGGYGAAAVSWWIDSAGVTPAD